MSFSANQLRPGIVIEFENNLWICLEAVHKTPGNKRAFVQAKLRNVREGYQKDVKFSSNDVLERVTLRAKQMQYLYAEEAGYHFMDLESYDQILLDKEMVGQASQYLLPDAQVQVTFFEDLAIGLELPQKLEFAITEAEPNLKTATATNAFKNAVIETGITVKVPPFIEAGDRIVMNTETGEYVERAKK